MNLIDPNPSKWDLRFLEMAKVVAGWSKDPSTKCGSVIVAPNKGIVGIGYNGFPPGVADTPERLGDRAIKYPIIRHSETNAFTFANHEVKGCTIYNWPMMSCASCASNIIAEGIVEVVAPMNDNPRWNDSFNLSFEILLEAGVKVRLISNFIDYNK